MVLFNAITASINPRGVERVALGLLPALAALPDSPSVVVVTAPWQSYYGALDLAPRLRRVVVAAPRERILRGLWQLLGYWQRRAPADLIHLGNVLPLPMSPSSPVVVSVHDVMEYHPVRTYSPVRRLARRALLARVATHAAAIVTLHSSTAAGLTEIFNLDPGRVHVVGAGSPGWTRMTPLAAEARDPTLLFVGAVDHHKRLDLVVHALVKLPELRLCVITPGGSAETRVRRLINQCGVASRVAWLGMLSDAAMIQQLRRAAALVMSSDHEGLGLPVLEALHLGTPVILSSALPLSDEWSAMGGPVFSAGDANDLAAVAHRFMGNHKHRDVMAVAGQAFADAHPWSSAARRLNNVYRTVLSGR